MSGGHWNHRQHEALSLLEDVAKDLAVAERFPLLAERLLELRAALDSIVHTLDFDLSADASIKDDKAFQRMALRQLRQWGSRAPYVEEL